MNNGSTSLCENSIPIILGLIAAAILGLVVGMLAAQPEPVDFTQVKRQMLECPEAR